jgi:hypothetical protein
MTRGRASRPIIFGLDPTNLAYKGKPLSEEDARLWERVIVEDFAELRKAGLRRPMMAEIEKELGVSP